MFKELRVTVFSENVDLAFATMRGSEFSSGFDLRADLSDMSKLIKINEKMGVRDDFQVLESGILRLVPNGRILVPTGLYIAIPVGYEMQVRPRSGLAIKHGVSVLNTPGTVDSDYRGEVGVILINNGAYVFDIAHGDRVAQAVFVEVFKGIWKRVYNKEELPSSDRNEGGFGSSGKK